MDRECDYVPDREILDDGKSRILKQVFCDSYNTVELTQRIVNVTRVHRNMTSTANSVVHVQCQ